jgi:hypothetical protein
MTDPGTPVTYRYVSDGQMPTVLDRETMARVNRPLAWSATAFVGFGLGSTLLLGANRASLPYHPGEVVLLSLLSGVVMALVMVIAGLVGMIIGRAVSRARMRRLFPTGSVTEVRLEQDALVLTRPASTRTVPYDRVRRVRRYEHTRWVVVRARPFVEVLPASLLPDQAVEILEARAAGARPPAWSPAPTGPVRDLVVPEGWAAHVAAVSVRATLRSPRFWARLGLALLVAGVAAHAAGPLWLAVGPALALIAVTVAYLRTREAMARATPSGSVASIETLDDRLVSRTARWTRDIRFDEVRAVDVHDDVVFLVMTSAPRRLALARALLPDAILERLRSGGTSPEVHR